jgi:hypothetical protein
MVVDEAANTFRVIGETQLTEQAGEIVHRLLRVWYPGRSAKSGVHRRASQSTSTTALI